VYIYLLTLEEINITMDRSIDQAVDPVRDDQILPLTRWLARLIVPVLAFGFILLYLWPDNTEEMFAWTIRPRMTPLLMGAGYLGGAYFFLRAALAEKWHHIAVGLLPVTTFASFMTVATIIHWPNFNHTHPAFFVWAILYAVTPFLVFYAWWENRKRDTGLPDPGDPLLPAVARWIMGVFGFVILATGILLFVFPSLMIDIWPWALSPLTARVGGGWFALPGVLWLGIAQDPRWQAARIGLESQALSLVLILWGVVRAWADFDQANPLTWIFVGGMTLLLLIIVVVYGRLEFGRRG
jgi:hypothetical protein